MKHDNAAKSFLIALGISALILSSSLFLSAARARGAPAPRAPAITDQLRIGSEFFLNRTETKESVQRHFRIMHENGLTLVRIFVIWDDIERTPDNWDLHGLRLDLRCSRRIRHQDCGDPMRRRSAGMGRENNFLSQPHQPE